MSTAVMLEFLGVLKLATIFSFVLAIIWINRHYRARKAQASVLADEEKQTLDDLSRVAAKLEERVGTLEKILDAEQPKWRDHAA
ncbi:MAG: envelope stress response membrane protein PspB [Rhodospirillaceae bacterium]|nr:envelope stress response membrane protein PspB [Rhodospirillaceae bacterium]